MPAPNEPSGSPRLGQLSSRLGLGPDPWAQIALLESVYEAIDAEIRREAAGLELPCREGCDACCHESVFLSAPEFLMVVAELKRRPSAEVASIRDAMKRLAEVFADELELLEALEAGPERDEVAARIKFRCPFLSSGGRCSIYGIRELNARTFGQTYDVLHAAAYGCGLTHERLRVLGPASAPRLFGARAARARLLEAFPSAQTVHVYPWWFTRFASYLE